MSKCPICESDYEYPAICYCMAKANSIKKMMANIRITESGCWEWTGKLCRAGYGLLSMRKNGHKHQRAYRVSYVIFKGDIPDDMTVDHICRNRPCFNPDHLRLLSLKDNILAGISPCAEHAKQTHCIHGHPLSGDNVYLWKGRFRQCKACNRKHQLEHNWYRPKKITLAASSSSTTQGRGPAL